MQDVVMKATEETTVMDMPVEDVVALVNHATRVSGQHHGELLVRLQVIADSLDSVADSLKRIADAMTASK